MATRTAMAKRVGVLLAVAAALVAIWWPGAANSTSERPRPSGDASISTRAQERGAEEQTMEESPHPYVGMWVTADNEVRQELLPDGRYQEARGTRERAYTGSYRIEGKEIFYEDDSGFSADGVFRQDVLHHGGMVFYRQSN